jgi:DNA-binding transcriptional MocR family regulator
MAVISFARGVPSPDLLPVDLFAEAARAAIERNGRTILNYGPAAGYPPLKEWIAERHGADPAQIVITNGSLQGFDFLVRSLFAEGGRALVEAPSYDRTIKILKRTGAQVDSIALEDEGLDVDALEESLRRFGPPKLLYTIPTFQNPAGRTLSVERRRRVAELVAEFDLLVYEDDPYGLVRFEGEPLPSLYELTGKRIVFSSSFSKTIAPGVRVGYLILPERLVKPVEALATDTYVSAPIFAQGVLYEFLRGGHFEQNLEGTCRGLRSRRDAMLAALEREFPDGSAWSRPDGGYFLWLDLPAGLRAEDLLERATAQDVTFVKGSDFFAGEGGEEAARLAFSFASVAEIENGICTLGQLVRSAAAVAA